MSGDPISEFAARLCEASQRRVLLLVIDPLAPEFSDDR
jgi:hypothetical protein